MQRTLHSAQPLTDEPSQRLLEIVAHAPVAKSMREGVDITSARGINLA